LRTSFLRSIVGNNILKKILLSYLLFIALLWSIQYVVGREAPPDKQRFLRHEVDVSLKLIQVYVTDKTGNPVRDLSAAEFALYDDKKPVTVTDFERHDLGAVYSSVAPRVAKAAESDSERQLGQVPTINRRFILYFDLAYNTVKGFLASQRAALHFLDNQVKPGDEVALVTMSMMSGQRFREYFTSDVAKVKQSVAMLSSRDIAGRADQIEQAYWQIAGMAKEFEGGPAEQEKLEKARVGLEGQRKESKLQGEDYVLALTNLAKAVRLVPGQKSLIFFSTGMPYSLIYGNPSVGGSGGTAYSSGISVAKLSAPSQFDIGNTRIRSLHEQLLKELSAANCALYTFDTKDAAKLASLFAFEAPETEALRSLMFSPQGVFRDQGNLFQDQAMTGEDTLRRIAKETGGRYYSNLGFYEQNLENLHKLTGTYYVLGYPWKPSFDGKFHDIRVEVKRKGCKVSFQKGYYNPKPFVELSELEQKLNFLDLALNERSELGPVKSVPISTLAYGDYETCRLSVLTRLSKESLSLFTGRRAELVSLVFDEEDRLVDLGRMVADPTTWKGKDVLFSASTAARPGRYLCRIVVRDLDNGASAVASANVYLQRPPSTMLSLGTPLIFADSEPNKVLHLANEKKLDHPNWINLYRFDTERQIPLAGVWGPDEFSDSKCSVALPIFSNSNTGVMVTANLINASTGASTPLPLALQERLRVGNADVLSYSISLGGIDAGTYMVYFYAIGQGPGMAAHAFTNLEIRR